MTDHATAAAFGRDVGRLTVGGVPVDRLAERAGSTPFFAYDRRLLTERIGLLRATLPPEVKLSYAVKANPMPAVVQHLAGLVDGLDVASALEMRTALDTTVPPERISFAGPGKTDAELRSAIAAGVTVEMESENEADRVAALGRVLGIRPRVAVRVNPDFAVKGSGMRLGGGPQQFGVDAERVPALLKDLERADVDFLGFHIFAGSQNLHADILAEAQRRTVDLAVRLAGESPLPVRYLNLGGGFGIPYHDRDVPLDLAAIGANLTELVAGPIRAGLPRARVAIELGRYIVGEAGVYVTRVIDRKESRGTTFLVVDGGLHHQLAASGNFGQVIRRNYPLGVATRIDGEPEETVTVVGCLCTPLDLLGKDVSLPRAGVGDLIVLFQAGAYGLTASPTAFLGHPAPAEMLL
ncbi:diaminopimelate decarboxylase [Actinoplanes campanulatus]|uniref:Diaminopimelate decarboxylase n=1 Tax=Actinoplanes campanulatus TaxID=113559 RepID=A0A7W5FD19_9ACTN|nr:pyridoxal-dependent decarboxylase, exosortase A system-associated [Actinoplanes campanulatus]MBB3093998.1 diaminopimelate decarboxylase [Actinoplanes campanulatus]GGN33377.1 pyridoxal-dependent decarboxylase, exosortase A system-associated [Actinoplanes campanulatus]GID38306.1 pyridoxal-dependent decarboxylase, exosortase A system-associated [Actinoplanes campanulatus]